MKTVGKMVCTIGRSMKTVGKMVFAVANSIKATENMPFGVAGRYVGTKNKPPACRPARRSAGNKDFKVFKDLKVLIAYIT
jgi:hypothetical protein